MHAQVGAQYNLKNQSKYLRQLLPLRIEPREIRESSGKTKSLISPAFELLNGSNIQSPTITVH